MENLINNDLNLISSDESDNGSDNENENENDNEIDNDLIINFDNDESSD